METATAHAPRPGPLPRWLLDEVATVPEIATFPDVDEMAAEAARIAAEHPGTVTHRRVGTSARGEPLICLTVGEGAAHAIVVGLPHPNEPIGGSTALHLARRLAADADLRARLDLTWHLVPCIDPDGLRLNEGWLKGPYTREHYSRHFFRQAGPEQVEWTFPVDHKEMYFDAVLPETLALMRLMDTHRPVLLASLHNAETGGAYYYLTHPDDRLHSVLQDLPEHLGVPLHRGEPEAPWIPQLAEGVYRALDIRDAYDHLEAHGEPGAHRALLGAGNSTAGHLAPHDTLGLVVELPYWLDPRAGSTTPTTTTRADALARRASLLEDLAETLDGVLAAVADRTWVDSPFLRAARFYTRMVARAAEEDRGGAGKDGAAAVLTVAELTSLDDVVHMYRLRYAGMLLRALDGELAVGNTAPAVRTARAALAARYAGWCDESAVVTPTEPLPIRTLVGVQYGAVLAAAAHRAGTLDTAR